MTYLQDLQFIKCSKFTLLSEGPMSNDKYDPGGLTKFGIDQKDHPTIDTANLTQEQALQIYYTDYYLKVGCNLLQFPFALAHFECSVNQGQGTATLLMQQVLGLQMDGILGPASQDAMSKVGNSAQKLASYMSFRISEYVGIKSRNPDNYNTNHNGWYRRLILCTIAGTLG